MMTPNAVKMTKAAFKTPNLGLGGAGQGVGVAVGVASIPVKRVGGALFGKNAYGVPHVGSQWMGNRFGGVASMLSGGGTLQGQPIFRWRGLIPGRRGSNPNPTPRNNNAGNNTGGSTNAGGGTPPTGAP